MKHKQRKFTVRTALLSALIVSVLASAAAFLGASAAENSVSPTDVARSSVSRSDATRSNVSRSDVVEMTAAAQAEPKVMEEEPVTGSLQIEMTTSKAAGETMSLSVEGENISIDWGNGDPVADVYVGGTLGENSVKIYGNVTSLECHDQQLTALDVSKATALKWLNCYNNNLTTLDVSNNTALTDLSCYNNNLTTLDVSNNTALTHLSCNDNNLTTLGMSKNTALKELYCYNNNLTTLDVSNNTALTLLWCDNNNQTTLDVSKNTALTHLACNDNNLTTLDVSKNTALITLECSGNQLKTLDLSHNDLGHLICYDNQLTTLDLSHMDYMWEIDCDHNQLTSLKLPKFRVDQLSCEDNQLTSLDVSYSWLPEDDDAIQFIFCANNKLKFSTLKIIGGTDSPYHRNRFHRICFGSQGTVPIKSSIPAGSALDLSSEYDIDGTKTLYTWYDSEGNKVTPSRSENGIFTFGNELVGKTLHCEMTNERYMSDPYFGVGVDFGDQTPLILITSDVLVEKAEETPTTTTTTTADTTTTAAPEIDNGLTVTGEEASAVADAGYSDDLKVTDDNGEVVPVGELQLIVSNIEKDKKKTVLEAIKHYAKTFHVDENNTALYDISLVDNNKAHVNVKNGKITVCLKYPDNLGRQAEKYTYKLYHQKADGTIEEIPVTCKPNGIWFEAADFSPYALAWSVSTGSSPGTGESNVLTWIAVNLALLSLAGAGAVIYKKKLIAE